MVQDLGELAAIRSGDFLKRERYSREAVNPVPVAGAGGPIGWTEQANCQPPVLALGRVGAAGVVRSYDTPVWATDNVLVVEPRDERYHAWIRFFLQTVNWPELRTGSTQPLITQTVVRRILIPVPPVEEQRRIVAKVEALLARVNAARDRLARVPAILKRFRQSILAAACSGRLTGDWREQEGRGDTAGTLLEAILADRRRRFGGMLQEARTAGGRQPGAPKNLERSEVEAGDLPALPDSWAWAVWDDLVDWITYGFTRPMPHVPDGVPIVTAKSIRDSRIDLDSLDHTTTEAFEALSEKDRPQVGEILLTKDGSIGRAAIVQTSEPFCINQSVAVLRFGGLTAFVPYLLHLIHSDLTQRRIEAAAKGTAIPHISITAFGRLPVPLPPVREQQEIVDRVEALFALADTIEQRATAALRRTDRLAQSILSKAFRGELMQTANGSVGPPK